MNNVKVNNVAVVTKFSSDTVKLAALGRADPQGILLDNANGDITQAYSAMKHHQITCNEVSA